MKKVCIIGQFAPPIHGLSKALDTLCNSKLKKEYNLKKINITNNKKLISNIIKILLSNCDLYYLTISQSSNGNIRDLIILKLLQIKRKKIIVHLHGGGFRYMLDNEFKGIQRKINYKILSEIDAAIVLGNSLKYIFKGIVPEKKIHVINNCVDKKYILSDDEFLQKIKDGTKNKSINILYMSNFIEDKGYKEVLRLAKFINDKKKDNCKFTFAGAFFSEEDRVDFMKFVEQNKLSDIISYKGIVTGKEKMRVILDNDIFILLTKYKNEGQPISIIEAAANGLYIISTNHAGIGDILTDEEMLMYDVDKINIGQIYKDIEKKIIDNNDIGIELKKNRERILNIFSEEKYIYELERLFEEIILR